MKVTIDWLKKYVNFSYNPDELAHRLTMLGLEVEGINYLNYDFEKVVIGKINNVKPHPDKQNLSLCDVNVGDKSLNLVCGAPNVDAGKKVAVALVGAKLPNDVTVDVAKIHGYESPGMICSEAELGLSHQSDIIMVLDNKAKIGEKLENFLGDSEIVIEIDLTPNRPDCLGLIGVAREISAINGVNIHKPNISLIEDSSKKIEDFISVKIENPESCPRYTARYVEGIKVGPSPRWLIQKLEAIGLRTINNIVDITNYVMMETGQPLHAFDYNMLERKKIIVRHAHPKEKFITLDEKEHTLPQNTLLICDGKKPIALAGIMGGLNSEISKKTKNVLLESALFDPINIRRTAKSLSISTDSSQRFERGVDPDGLLYALDRATQLINELAGGTIAKNAIDHHPKPYKKTTVELKVDSVNNLLGTSFNSKEICNILTRLEFKVDAKESIIKVEVPSFRVDIEREVDLIEEVARIYGFDKIKGNTFSKVPHFSEQGKEEKFNQILRESIVRMGYNEIVTNSLLNKINAVKFTNRIPIQLANPISEDLGTLRTSILPGALQVLKWNKNRKIKDQSLFEIGNVFYLEKKNIDSRKEIKKIAFIRTGNISLNSWLSRSRETNFYNTKGDVISVLNRLGIKNIEVKPADIDFLNHTESLKLYIKNEYLGYMGKLSASILTELDIGDDVFVAELDFGCILNNYNWEKKVKIIPKYPSIQRDFSIVVDQLVSWAKIEKIIWANSNKLLKSIELFDVFRGKQIEKKKKSFAFSLTFLSDERTLTENEIDVIISQILENLKSKLNAELRA